MFYSHEILTSRKYGVATIWLVATLGGRATSKRVNKKTILEVDIPKACDVVIQPEAPMALRLQSNLLCGISRVYSQQCNYVFVDAQSTLHQMRHFVRVVQASSNNLDLETARPSKSETLILSEDPSFLPDLDLALDLNILGLGEAISGSSQTDRVVSSQARISSQTSGIAMPDLLIPSSSDGACGFDLSNFGRLEGEGNGLLPHLEDADIFLPEPDLSFDQDGNILGFDEPSNLQETCHVAPPTHPLISTRLNNHALSRAHSQTIVGAEIQSNTGEPISFVQESEIERGPTINCIDHCRPRNPHFSQELQMGSDTFAQETPKQAAAASLRERRRRKILEVDLDTQVRKAELMSWTKNYLANMNLVWKKRDAARSGAQSRKNADWWVWGAGIADIGYEFRAMDFIRHPLGIFQGAHLRELMKCLPASKKRPAPVNDDDGIRNVRRRSADQEGVLGLDLHDDTIMNGMGEDLDPEIARHAPTPDKRPLGDDRSSSAMPWNLSASALGRRPSGSLPSYTSHAADVGLSHLAQARGTQPNSRLTSASPLLIHGISRRSRSRQSSVEPIVLGEPHELSSRGIVAGGEFDEFDRFGPAVDIGTPDVSSQWLYKALDFESTNFLSFVAEAIEQHGRGIYFAEEERRGIPFDELLPSQKNTVVVGAQAFHHALALSSKNLMWMHQTDNNSDLWIGILRGTIIPTEPVDFIVAPIDPPG